MHHSSLHPVIVRALSRSFVLLLAGSLVVACGDDDGAGGTGGGSDSGMPGSDGGANGGGDGGGMNGCIPEGTRCPDDGPDMGASLCGSCCYRQSSASNDAVELRIASLELTQPASLSTTLVSGLLQATLDEETFNWLIQIDGVTEADGDVTIKTGFGVRNADHTFSFSTGMAPGPGSSDRWDPVEVPATLTGGTLAAEPYSGTMTVPVFQQDAMTISLELAIRGLQVESATLTDSNSCIGVRGVTKYRNDSGSISGYITVDDAKSGDIEVSETQTINLCMLIANMSTADGDCDSISRDAWPLKPDALCDDSGCTTGSCDPNTDCNAWKLVGGFAAHGVSITN